MRTLLDKRYSSASIMLICFLLLFTLFVSASSCTYFTSPGNNAGETSTAQHHPTGYYVHPYTCQSSGYSDVWKLSIPGKNIFSAPVITDSFVYPIKVQPGDLMTVSVSALDVSDVTHVQAKFSHDHGFDLVTLSLVSGTPYNGIWQGHWIVHDTHIKEYTTTVTVFSSSGSSASTTLLWQDPVAWWNYDWGYRKLITLSHSQVPSDQTNFPVLINISTDTDLRDSAQSNGNDIAFTDASGNQLHHQIEKYTSATGQLIAWVNVTSLSSSSDTQIYMYYGNSGCSSQQSTSGVWDGNYLGVWHLNESSGTILDSTSNGKSGTLTGATYSATGKISNAISFDGTNDYIDITIDIPSTVTISAWGKSTASSLSDMLWCIGNSGNGGPDLFFYTGMIYLNTWDGGSNPFCSQPATVSQWHLYTTIIESGNTKLYIDGGLGGSGTYKNPTKTSFAISSSNGYDWEGSIDEFRISNIARNANWILTEYNNINNATNGGFHTLGTQELSDQTSPTVNITYNNPNTYYSDADTVTIYATFTENGSGIDETTVTITINTTGTDITAAPMTKINNTYWSYTWDVPSGSDGNVNVSIYAKDNATNTITGTNWSTTKYIDNTKPTSNVETISPYWKTTTPITITATATDTASGVSNVTLYYHFSTDNTSWGDWVSAGTDTQTSWSWSFNLSNNTGYYEFYSIATDNASNTETTPGAADSICGYDHTSPTCTIQYNTTATYLTVNTPVQLWVNFTEDLSGINPDTVRITIDTTDIDVNNAAMTQTNNTHWYYLWTVPVGSDGNVNVSITAQDNATNTISGIHWNTEKNIDNTKPTSSVDTISTYWKTTTPITITATADDTLSGIQNVTFYYRYSTDNTTWDGWVNNGTDTISPWTRTITFSNGTGYYQFYSIATDNVSNTETSSGAADAICGYDFTAPASSVDTISPYWSTTTPLSITATANDATSGVRNVTFYYRYSADNITFGGWVNNGTDTAIPWSRVITFANGTGYYQFYSIATDNATNTETTTGTDTTCGYDSSRPTSNVDTIFPYWKTTTPITITATASATTSGVRNVTLYYHYSTDNTSWGGWVSAGTDEETPWSWSFNLSNNTGYYEFYSIATDNATNAETVTGTADAICAYDHTKPTSSVDTIFTYWKTTTPITLTATADDATSCVRNVTLYYHYSTDNTTWEEWTQAGTDTELPWSWSFNLSNNTGYYEFYSIATDNATNTETTSGTADTTCAYDHTTPTCTIQYNNTAPFYKVDTPVQLWVNFTEDLSGINPDTVRITIDTIDIDIPSTPMTQTNNLVYYYLWTVPAGSDGNVNVSITAQDNATNTITGTNWSTEKTIDNTYPTVTIEYNNTQPYYNNEDAVTIYANFTENLSGINENTVTITINTTGTDVSSTPMTKTNNTHWAYTWDVPTDSEDQVNITIYAEDNATNPVAQTNWSTTKYIDNTPPNPPNLSTPANHSTSNTQQNTFTWNQTTDNTANTTNVSDIAYYELQISDDNFTTYLISQNTTNNQTYTLTSTIEGRVQWRVRAWDQAGNPGVYSDTRNLTIFDFTITATYTSLTILRGGTSTTVLETEKNFGENETINLTYTWSGITPTGITVNADTWTGNGSFTSTVDFVTSGGASTGEFTCCFTATSLTETETISITVQVAGMIFKMSATQTSFSLLRSDSATSIVTITFLYGSKENVDLSGTWIDDSPSGVTMVFSCYSDVPPFDSTLTITTNSNAAKGNYTYKITATGGGITDWIYCTIRIQTDLSVTIESDKTTTTSSLTIQTDRNSYEKGQEIILTGTAKDPEGNPVPSGTATITFSTHNWTDAIQSTITNGAYSARYYISFDKYEGQWNITVTAVDSLGHATSTAATLALTVTTPAVSHSYTVTILSPLPGQIYKRGEVITFTVNIAENAEKVRGATVTVLSPDGSTVSLTEISPGTYSAGHTLDVNSPTGNISVFVEGKSGENDMFKEGFNSLQITVVPTTLSLEILEPSGKNYEIGETIPITVQLLYPDGSPVEEGMISAITNGSNLVFKRIGDGIFSATYTPTETDIGSWNIQVSGIDVYDNPADLKKITVEIIPTRLSSYFIHYWYVTVLLIIGIVLALGYSSLKISRVVRLRNIIREVAEINQLKTDKANEYFTKGEISRETYDSLMHDYESKLAKLEKKRRILKRKTRRKKKESPSGKRGENSEEK